MLVSQSDVAIPLPPPLPFGNSAVPEPPPKPANVQIPFIGPVPPPGISSSDVAKNNGFSSNSYMNADELKEAKKKVNDLLAPCKVHTAVDTVNDEVLSDQEIANFLRITPDRVPHLRKNWVSKFIEQGGIHLLLQILSDLNTVAQSKPKGEALKSKVEKECWLHTMRILRVLLLAAFIAKQPQVDAQAEGAVKQDSPSDAAEVKPQAITFNSPQSNLLLEQDRIKNTYPKLIEVMKGDTGSKLLGSFNVGQVQEVLLQVMSVILQKKDGGMFDERPVVDQALFIWVTLLYYNPRLLPRVYEDAHGLNVSKILLEDGLLSNALGIRPVFKDQIQFIVDNIKSDEESGFEQPYMFFLRKMLSMLDFTIEKVGGSRQYYQVLLSVLQKYFKARQEGQLNPRDLLNEKALIDSLISKLVAYTSSERKNATMGQEDNNLIGFLNLIQELLKNNESSLLSSDDHQALTFEILNKCLFSFDIQPLETDITPGVDIAAYEKPQLNKCHQKTSRQAAFALLITLCKINPSVATDIIQTYLYPIITTKVHKPKKGKFNPSSENRSNGFCGLRNLGCICYMNSVLQQFFNVPTFRYSMLAVKDNTPVNLVEFEGDQIDDNFLHQFKRTFGFLELSERLDFTPRDLCFSFKDYSGQPTNVRIQQDA